MKKFHKHTLPLISLSLLLLNPTYASGAKKHSAKRAPVIAQSAPRLTPPAQSIALVGETSDPSAAIAKVARIDVIDQDHMVFAFRYDEDQLYEANCAIVMGPDNKLHIGDMCEINAYKISKPSLRQTYACKILYANGRYAVLDIGKPTPKHIETETGDSYDLDLYTAISTAFASGNKEISCKTVSLNETTGEPKVIATHATNITTTTPANTIAFTSAVLGAAEKLLTQANGTAPGFTYQEFYNSPEGNAARNVTTGIKTAHMRWVLNRLMQAPTKAGSAPLMITPTPPPKKKRPSPTSSSSYLRKG